MHISNEYRLAIPAYVHAGEKHCDIRFDVKDLTGIYLGCRLPDEEQKKVTTLASSMNSQITVKRAGASKHEYVMQFEDI